MYGKPDIDSLFQDHPVLDIFHIAYIDFVQGRLTTIEKINKIMVRNYPDLKPSYLRKQINIIVNSHWFKRPNGPQGQVVHLVERGVEAYLSMAQNYSAEKWAEDANIKTKWIIFLTIIAIIMTVVGMLIK